MGKALEISERLAKQDQSNADWQRDLAVTYLNLAHFFQATEDLERAASNAHSASLIYEKLLALGDIPKVWNEEAEQVKFLMATITVQRALEDAGESF